MAGDNLYYMGNHVLPTAGLPTAVQTGTAAAAVVMLQLAVPSTRAFTLVEYGISFTGAPSAIQMQLRATSATTATAGSMTAGVILPFTPGAPTSLSTSSTSASCFYSSGTAAALPTATVSKIYDTQVLSTNQYVKQWPLNREPGLAASDFLQLCLVAATAVTASCYFIWRE